MSLARVVTWGGTTAFVLPALFVVGAISPRRGRSAWDRWGGGLLLAGIGGFGVYVGLAINAWVGRPRPPIEVWAGVAGGPSFPSGHTTTATLFAVVCAWVLTARATPGRARATLWTGAVMYALAVGWSRVWLGVHWPSDVTGGLLYGVAWCATCMAVASWWRWRRGRGAAIRGTLLTLARHRFDARHREVPLSSGDPPAAPGMLVSAAGAGQRLMLACGRIVAWSEGFR